ncbi:MAG: hypothetical protein ABIS47_01820, partial [Acidimicrobiales bacterium]
RRWTLVGPAGGPAAAVDPAGLVTPRLGGWSLDWWVGADDRWRLPSAEPSLRQSLVEATPVVETLVRVPAGDAVHRCFGVPGFLVVEVENRSPSPFALALVVRPYDPLGATVVRSVAVDGDQVLVDGRVAVVLAGRPGRVAASTGAAGDVAGVVLGGAAAPAVDGGGAATLGLVACPDGLASAAVLVPVAHRATVRAVVPLDGGSGPVDGLPSAAVAVRGWRAQSRGGMQANVPDPRLQRAFDAARRTLLLVEGQDPGPAEGTALAVAALARTGRHAEADELVRTLWCRQRSDGSFDEPTGRGAPGGPHLWALGEHLRLRPDAGLAGALDRSLVAAEGWLREVEASDPAGPGSRLEPSGSMEGRWAAAGRWLAGHSAGEAGLAAAAASLFGGLGAAGGPSSTAADVLALAAARGGGLGRPAIAGPAGFDVVATAAAAAAEVAAGDPAAEERLAWLLEVGEPTWAWPDHVHPRTGAGSEGRGHSPAATAAFVLLVRDLLIIEPAPGQATVLPLLPEGWRGQALEVDDVPLAGGIRLSFAVRWHGERPALLWEATAPLRLTAPGLDRSFSATGARGEALLAGAPVATGATVELS